MSCGLSLDELFILNILYSSRCLKTSAGYHCKKLENIYVKKYSTKFDKIMKKLQNKGYITSIKKKDLKYYISDIKAAIIALDAHEYSVTKGKVKPL